MMVSDVVSAKSGVFFDLFFTLVSTDVEDDKFPRTEEVLGVDKSAWRRQVFGTSHARLTGAETDPYQIVESMAHAIDPGIPGSVIREATDQRIARFEHVLTNVPESSLFVLDALRRAGLKIGLITNADIIETRAWEHSPLAPLFDATVLSWRVGFAKPDARIYRHGLELLNLSASQCVFVGDGGSDELSGAQAVGLTSVFTTSLMPELTPGEIRQRESHADHVVDKLEELLPRTA